MATDLGTNLVLVTGAAGWLGRRLVDVLAHGLPDDDRFGQPQANIRIRCFVQAGQEKFLAGLGSQIEVVTGDLSSPADCTRFCSGANSALLVHTAGVIHPHRVREFYTVNLEGTRQLLDAAQAASIRRAVIVSSNSPCGCNPSREHLFTEQSPYNPYMHYGRSKMLMEQAVQAVQQAGELETVILRPPWFYGPFQPPRQTQFFRMIRDGKAPLVGDGSNRRSMAYIDNSCQGLLLAATVPQANGQTYWIADARPYTMVEILDTVERLLEKEFDTPCAHKRMRLPSVASEVAFALDKTLQSIGLYQQKIHVLSEMNKTIACSIDHARASLGYRPTVDLEEGMRRSLKWCFETKQLP